MKQQPLFGKMIDSHPGLREELQKQDAEVDSQYSVKWCKSCGEGVVRFCRGKCGDTDCPMKLPNPPNLSQQDIADEARAYARHAFSWGDQYNPNCK